MLGEQRGVCGGGAHMVLCGGTRSLATKTAMGVGGREGATRALLSGWWWWLGLVWGAKATR